MDKARSLHDVLELNVFAANPLGRAFYARYGFVPIKEFVEETTGEATLRLRYEAEKVRQRDEGESGIE
jgi:putative acetyltransferase